MDLLAMGNRVVSDIANTKVPSTVPHQTGGASLGQANGTASFADMLSNAMGDVVGTDYEDKAANLGLMVGEVQDAHSVMIAAEKADLTLQLTMQVRNKMIEAYQEVMRMQI